jgi:hypothetical protein
VQQRSRGQVTASPGQLAAGPLLRRPSSRAAGSVAVRGSAASRAPTSGRGGPYPAGSARSKRESEDAKGSPAYSVSQTCLLASGFRDDASVLPAPFNSSHHTHPCALGGQAERTKCRIC